MKNAPFVSKQDTMKKAWLRGAAITLALSGCAPQGQTGANTGAQQPGACANGTALTTTAEGGAVGGILGVAAGMFLGKSVGAALGGLGGAAAGALTGNAIANNNCQQALTEDRLKADISEANANSQKYAEDARKYNARTAYELRMAARLQNEYQKGQISAETYRRQASALQVTQRQLQQELSEIQAEQRRLQADAQRADQRGQQLNGALQDQMRSQAQLQHDADMLAHTLSEVPQG